MMNLLFGNKKKKNPKIRIARFYLQIYSFPFNDFCVRNDNKFNFGLKKF